MRDCKHASSETSCLICVGVGRSDGRLNADSSLHAITKVPRIFDNSTVLMMGINKGVKEAHHHNTIVKASQEHPGDQVMQLCSLSVQCNGLMHAHTAFRTIKDSFLLYKWWHASATLCTNIVCDMFSICDYASCWLSLMCLNCATETTFLAKYPV